MGVVEQRAREFVRVVKFASLSPTSRLQNQSSTAIAPKMGRPARAERNAYSANAIRNSRTKADRPAYQSDNVRVIGMRNDK